MFIPEIVKPYVYLNFEMIRFLFSLFSFDQFLAALLLETRCNHLILLQEKGLYTVVFFQTYETIRAVSCYKSTQGFYFLDIYFTLFLFILLIFLYDLHNKKAAKENQNV